MWTLWNKIYYIKTVFEKFMKWGLKGGISIDADSGTGMYFDAVVAEVKKNYLLLRLAPAILCLFPKYVIFVKSLVEVLDLDIGIKENIYCT